jgi:hypothetical protein
MQLSTPWVIVFVVVVFAVIIRNIMLLKKSNKDFTFPDGYEKSKDAKKQDDDKNDDEPSSLI